MSIVNHYVAATCSHSDTRAIESIWVVVALIEPRTVVSEMYYAIASVALVIRTVPTPSVDILVILVAGQLIA